MMSFPSSIKVQDKLLLLFCLFSVCHCGKVIVSGLLCLLRVQLQHQNRWLFKKNKTYFFLGHRGIWKITAFLSSNVLENGTLYPSAVAAPSGGNVSSSGGLPSSSLSTHTSKLLAHTWICTCANAHTRTLAVCTPHGNWLPTPTPADVRKVQATCQHRKSY